MKPVITSALIAGLMLSSCKNESKIASVHSDTITAAKNTDTIPSPSPVDTLIESPKSNTASTNVDSLKAIK